jgi:murein DD-endopeptidase MepM/ murein hydrolase activator NlpD
MRYPHPTKLRWTLYAVCCGTLFAGLLVAGASAAPESPSSNATDLRREITALSTRVEKLEEPVARLQHKLDTLESGLRQRKQRLSDLETQIRRQEDQLVLLERELDVAEAQLMRRIVAIYKEGNTSVAQAVVASGSVTELFERLDTNKRIVAADQEVADKVRSLEEKVADARETSLRARSEVREQTRAIERDRAKAAKSHRQLAQKKRALEVALADRNRRLDSAEARAALAEANDAALDRASGNLQSTVQAGAALNPTAGSGGASVSLGWPVSGPVVSSFGMRDGKMHSGIDISAPAGTPTVASGSGTVTYAGWMSGYGNLVVIQHAGGLSTAYAHLSKISAGNGQSVSRGQLIGSVGCTGHCFGDHVHFETRLNGGAVDPMNYL